MRMDSIPVDTPMDPQPPPMDEPPAGRREPIIDEPGREIPAVDPRRPGEPRRIREPEPTPDEPPSGPATATAAT